MEPLAAAVLMCAPLTSGPIPDPLAVVGAYIEAYNAHDVDGLRQVIAADAHITPLPPSEPNDGATLLHRYEFGLFKNYPDVKTRVVRRLSEGDMVAQIEVTSGIGDDQTTLSTYRVDRGCIVEMSFSQ